MRGEMIQKYKINNILDEIEWHFNLIRGSAKELSIQNTREK